MDTCTVCGWVDNDGSDDNDFVDISSVDVGVDDVNVVYEDESFNDDDGCRNTCLHDSGDSGVVNNGGGGDSAVADDAVVSPTPTSDDSFSFSSSLLDDDDDIDDGGGEMWESHCAFPSAVSCASPLRGV